MSVNSKIMVVWDVTPCRLLDRHRHFGGSFCCYLQGRCVVITDSMELSPGEAASPFATQEFMNILLYPNVYHYSQEPSAAP